MELGATSKWRGNGRPLPPAARPRLMKMRAAKRTPVFATMDREPTCDGVAVARANSRSTGAGQPKRRNVTRSHHLTVGEGRGTIRAQPFTALSTPVMVVLSRCRVERAVCEGAAATIRQSVPAAVFFDQSLRDEMLNGSTNAPS